jgi:mono/diheme cytochrome c family protein
MKTAMFCIGLTVLCAASFAAKPDQKALIGQGRQTFEHLCKPCHGHGAGDDGREMLPAPTALTLKYGGSKSPYLEERADLPYPALRVFVRRGSWSMPAFRKTEITDQEIEAVAAYLQDSSRKR